MHKTPNNYNYTFNKKIFKNFLPLVMALLQGIKKRFGHRLIMEFAAHPFPGLFYESQLQTLPNLRDRNSKRRF
jgi:hypothetical protein